MDQVNEARRAAATAFGVPVDKVFAQKVTAAYPWVHKHALFMAQDSSFRRMLVAVAPDGASTAFNDPSNLKAVNRLLQAEGIKLPDGVLPEQLAGFLRALLLGPGGFVGSTAFCDEQKGALAMWTAPSPKDGPSLFQNHCQEPSVTRSNGEWEIVFFYFNNKGGIEKWQVSGDSEEIREAQSSMPVPDGTFLFPYG